MTKFELTDETLEYYGHTLHRIRLTEDCQWGKKGTLGGFVEYINNLFEDAWIADDAKVYDNAQVYGFSDVYGDTHIHGNTNRGNKGINNKIR